MPKQKDLKRLVRSRMQKTGEAYTAARRQVLQKSKATRDYAALAGRSDAVLSEATGKTWEQWVRILERARADDMTHGEIAAHVRSLGTPSWWSQTVAVGYERIKGRRQIGQRSGGQFAISKSRTIGVPVTTLYDAFANARRRSRWLREKITVRKSTPNKLMRVTWGDKTDVQVYFASKGAAKSTVTIEHLKLPDKVAADEKKKWWADRLDRLTELLT
jgi:hypothetical protein